MKFRNLLLALTLVLSINACKKKDSTPVTDPGQTQPNNPSNPTTYVPDNSFKIVAYMPSYKDPESVDISKYKMITHLFYAFLEVDPAGDGSLKALSQPTRFATVLQRARANNVKVGISVSGASSIFIQIANSSINRTKFVNNVVTFAKNNMLDGVDIDWEYPSTTVNSTGSESSGNFTLLMQELSTELHKINKFLSAAVTPAVYAGGIRDGVNPAVFPYVDFFNIMQYDGPNYDSAEPLNHASYKMSVASMDIWMNTKGLPKEKAIVGIPLYGESANGAASKSYRDIEASGADVLTSNVATVGGVQYGYNCIALVKQKTQLAKDRGNGIMFWEFSFDSNTSKSLIRAANDQLGRAY